MNRRIFGTVILFIILGLPLGILIYKYSTPAPFILSINTRPSRPTSLPGTTTNITAFSGQKCIFLVSMEEYSDWLHGNVGLGEPIEISVQNLGNYATIELYPNSITTGQIAEILVFPLKESVNETLLVTITGRRHGLIQKISVSISVVDGKDEIVDYAVEMRNMFISWLAEYQPELNITDETEWTGTIVNPKILVVMHYIFLSEDWELYLTWHVMIPPYDWTKIYLRRRYTEKTSSRAFEVSSVSALSEPKEISVPEWI